MPNSPLRHELLVHSGERIPPVPMLPLILPHSSSMNWISHPPTPTTPTMPTTPAMPAAATSTFTAGIMRKPLPQSRIPVPTYTINSKDCVEPETSMLRGQSFSSECSSAPSMVPDYGSEESDVERDDDPYHENVAREWDAWHVDEQNAPRQQVLPSLKSLPCLPGSSSQQQKQQSPNRQHRPYNSEFTPSLCGPIINSRPRAATVTGNFIATQTLSSSTYTIPTLPACPTRPPPIPSQLKYGTFPPPVPPKHTPPPTPGCTPTSTHFPKAQTQPHKKHQYSLSRHSTTTRTALSLYPSSAMAQQSPVHQQVRPARSTPQLRPSPKFKSVAFPSVPPTPTQYLFPQHLPSAAAQEKSVFEDFDDSDDEGGLGAILNLAKTGVMKRGKDKGHVRGGSDGNGSVKVRMELERRGSDFGIMSCTEESKKKGRRSAGEIVRGLFGSGRRGSKG